MLVLMELTLTDGSFAIVWADLCCEVRNFLGSRLLAHSVVSICLISMKLKKQLVHISLLRHFTYGKLRQSFLRSTYLEAIGTLVIKLQPTVDNGGQPTVSPAD